MAAALSAWSKTTHQLNIQALLEFGSRPGHQSHETGANYNCNQTLNTTCILLIQVNNLEKNESSWRFWVKVIRKKLRSNDCQRGGRGYQATELQI